MYMSRAVSRTRLVIGGSERASARTRIRRSGITLTSRTTRSRRASRSRVMFSRSPGAKASAMTTKSKTFQPSLKKSWGRRP
jgi:hypothetical protein